jgi:cysteine protease ATG4
LILLIPLRLGVDKVNPLYIPQLKDVLENKLSLGIIGGKPKQSLYFVGFQGRKK